MIDTTRNLCYIVSIHYFIKNGVGTIKSKSHTYISLHSISTKKCEDFGKRKAKADKQFHSFNEDIFSQYTVPLSDYCK